MGLATWVHPYNMIESRQGRLKIVQDSLRAYSLRDSVVLKSNPGLASWAKFSPSLRDSVSKLSSRLRSKARLSLNRLRPD
jgi:hypothetical protein